MSLNPVPARLAVEGAPRAILIHLADARGAADGAALGALRALAPGRGFVWAEFCVTDWNADLSPWPADAAYGGRAFAGHAGGTLDMLLNVALPDVMSRLCAAGVPPLPRVIGGYSLAGLFALWAFHGGGAFAGAAAASPSVWFPDWDDWAEAHRPPEGGAAYLSLGRKEPRTRNVAMAAVGGAIERERARLAARGVEAVLEWNAGNHFTEPALRTAKGFAWALQHMKAGETR